MTVPRRRSRRFQWGALLAGLLGALLTAPAGWALTAPPALAALADLDDEEVRALETLALYDADTRDAALRVAHHPEILVDVELIQARSSEAFELLVGPRSREDQEAIWELSREPGLLSALVDGGPKSRRELEAIAARHPEAAREAILRVGGDHELLSELLDVRDQATAQFDSAIEPLSSRDRAAFREVIERPELTSLLARHVSLTVRLGDADQSDPEATRDLLAALAADVEQKNQEAGEDWTSSLAENPQARDDLERSARAYAAEYDYEYEALTDPRVATVVETTVHPYPYWFGYPAWYASPTLYPYGYWYPAAPHLGFYHASGHHAVFFSLPSPHFLHWFFALDRHRHYRHLTHHFEGHHHRHRAARGHPHRTVSRWQRARGNDHHRVERARHRPLRHVSSRHTRRSLHGSERRVEQRRRDERGIERRGPQRRTERRHFGAPGRSRDGAERRHVRRSDDRKHVRKSVTVERRSDRQARTSRHVERRTERRAKAVERRPARRETPHAAALRPQPQPAVRKATHANRFQRMGETLRAQRRAQIQRERAQRPQRVERKTSQRVRPERSDGGRRGGDARARRGGRGSRGDRAGGLRRR